MKIRFLQISFFLSAIYLVFTGYSGGPGAVGNFDRTGSPLSGGSNCTQCHSGGAGTTLVTVRMLDGTTPISSYTPGQVYTLEVQVTNSNFSLFGSQSVVLNGSNNDAGTLNTSPITANTQITTVSGRNYMEHDSRSPTGLFQTQWTAPAIGTGTVTVYAMGNAINNAGGSSGDKPSNPATLVLTEAVATTISYGQSNYCQDVSDPTPNITGTTGGSFSSTGGLSINSSTGTIDLSASTPATYTVTYTYGGGSTTTFNVTVTARDAATVSYGNTPTFCANASSNPTPNITGTGSGSFSSTAGLSINSSTGQVTLASSTAGSYTVTYTTAGVCPTTTTAPITILPAENAAFTFGGGTFCQSGSDPTPTIGGTSGGVFSSTPAGLSMSSSTGTIDVSASTIGSYQVTYTTGGTCSAFSTVTVNVTAAGSAAFNYASSTYCSSADDPTPTISGIGGGVFSSAGGLVINSSTGVIDLFNTTGGTYTIYYTVSGSCPAMDSAVVTVNPSDETVIDYDQATYCVTDNDPTADIVGTIFGTFSASPAGLAITASNGGIDLDASTPNTYLVTFISSGICPDTATTTVTVDLCSGINSTALNEGVNIYPNPTLDGTFNIQNKGNAAETELSIYNALGELITKEIFYLESNTSQQRNLPLDGAKGWYLIKLRQADKIESFRLLYK